jgi:hypothetical protein
MKSVRFSSATDKEKFTFSLENISDGINMVISMMYKILQKIGYLTK